jgi:hypothetical protein
LKLGALQSPASLNSTETTERNTGMLRVPHRRIAGSTWLLLPILKPHLA